ncbi:cupredoxin domain-containing protein [Candidatus Nitronereus thalassa]|uniref:Cupredoxin domain-containing protein n=1 Tax=Candidatus Nitronereus thalassa TaxID=3020898 RepID=A0ABU3K8W5_9BACT|nr:cupredoxin domain-containing protein [Candidatus Nitronereus thalassa]MDT7042828.1 cupredoxin domain-containing protein [Candidatus Nitronereus thalassa]
MLIKGNIHSPRRWLMGFLLGLLVMGALPQALAQSEQQIVVNIRNFTFETTQMPLQLHVPTVIYLKNSDEVRHDFGSLVFEGSHTRIETPMSISYGRGIGGVYIEPGGEVSIRFTIDRPGRYQFKCSIHEGMEGEILLMSAGAV